MTAKEMAERLRRWNRWSRGEGEFGWHEDPRANLPMPESPQELGMLLDEVAEVLERLGEASGKGGAV